MGRTLTPRYPLPLSARLDTYHRACLVGTDEELAKAANALHKNELNSPTAMQGYRSFIGDASVLTLAAWHNRVVAIEVVVGRTTLTLHRRREQQGRKMRQAGVGCGKRRQARSPAQALASPKTFKKCTPDQGASWLPSRAP